MNFLIELINAFINSLNTREIALIILFIVFLLVIFFIKNVRKAVLDVIRIFFSIKIIIPFIGMVLYISLILFILNYLGFLNLNLIKDVIFWFLIVSIPLFFAANKLKDDKNFFKTKAVEFVGLTTIIGFFINFYTFNLFFEIVLQIILFALILLIAVSKTQKRYKPVEKLLSSILFIIFACLVIFFIINVFTNPNEFININTVITFVLPGILTILVLPFIYFLALYMEYELFYVRLKVVLKESKLYKYVFKEVFKKYKLDLYDLDAFLSDFRIFNIKNNGDVEKEILKAQKRVKCTSDTTKTSYSNFKTYNNYGYSFEYPSEWMLDYENDANVYFNSTNGEIRVFFPMETGGFQIGGCDNAVPITLGDKTVHKGQESDSLVYSTLYPDNTKELAVMGPLKDEVGLERIVETFKST